jgi:alpha-glucuronidase
MYHSFGPTRTTTYAGNGKALQVKVFTLVRGLLALIFVCCADAAGLGFDRTATGSNAAAQYNSPLKEQFADQVATPEMYLLWFHHVPWDYTTKSGLTMWDELNYRYIQGVGAMEGMQKSWATLKEMIDIERFNAVSRYLIMQHRDAVWFRDACLACFATFSERSFVDGYQAKYTLEYYRALPPNAAPE